MGSAGGAGGSELGSSLSTLHALWGSRGGGGGGGDRRGARGGGGGIKEKADKDGIDTAG